MSPLLTGAGDTIKRWCGTPVYEADPRVGDLLSGTAGSG